MGCASCHCANFSNGPIELVYLNTRKLLSRRPQTIEGLISQVLRLVDDYEKPSDFVLEYITDEGIKPIFHDLSLEEAYIRHEDTKLIIGIKSSLTRSTRSSNWEVSQP